MFNGYTDFFNINFHIFTRPQLICENNYTPFFNKFMISNITLVSKRWNINMYIYNNHMWFDNKMLPVKIYYIVKNRENKSNELSKYFLFIDKISKSENTIFETGIINILRANPYLMLIFRKVKADIIRQWIKNDDLVEIFCLDNDNTIHSVYRLKELSLKSDVGISDQNNSLSINNFDYLKNNIDKKFGITLDKELNSTFFKNQLLDILQKLFKEQIIVNNVIVSEYKY